MERHKIRTWEIIFYDSGVTEFVNVKQGKALMIPIYATERDIIEVKSGLPSYVYHEYLKKTNGKVDWSNYAKQ
jgi:hypothetical protein